MLYLVDLFSVFLKFPSPQLNTSLSLVQENLSLGFPTRSDTKQAVQPQNRSWLDTCNLRFKKWMDCTTCIHVAKTNAQISFAASVQLICALVLVYPKIKFSHDAAHFIIKGQFLTIEYTLRE